MTKKVTNLPASVHARLQALARERGRPFQEIFYFYAIERFLYRLSQSRYSHDFVLKGALVFWGWGLLLRRPTRDIDVQGNMANDTIALVEVVRKICILPVEPDGMEFDPESILGEQINLVANQPGVRVRFEGHLGSARIWLQLDVSFANPIVPSEVSVSYPTMLSQSSFQLMGYPYETAIAEKVESMVDLGQINSRLKDFYDIWLLVRKVDIKGQVLVDAIAATFQARGTPIPASLPVALTDGFAHEKQQLWQSFIQRNQLEAFAPPTLVQVIQDLRSFLLPPLQAAGLEKVFNTTWVFGKGWKKTV